MEISSLNHRLDMLSERGVELVDRRQIFIDESVRLERIYLPQKSKRSQLFEGTPQETAAQLVEKLRFEARVI